MKSSAAQAQGYEARIRHLQGEITALQKQQDNNHRDITAHFGKRVQDALLAMTGHSTQLKGAEDKLKVEIRDMEEDLARQAEMNRIVLTKCNVTTMEKSDRKLVQQHRLTGHCYEQAFQVEFTLTDVMEDASVVRTVTDLNIVMDGSEFSHFSTFVSGAEDKRSLLLFFQTLRRFLERCEDRRRTFQHFQEKYPEVVLLPGSSRSEVMLIQNPQLPGCALTVHWTIEVTQDGVITPQVDLVTKMPEQALQVDSSKVIKNAPESFRSLVGILGVEASIESIIQSIQP